MLPAFPGRALGPQPSVLCFHFLKCFLITGFDVIHDGVHQPRAGPQPSAWAPSTPLWKFRTPISHLTKRFLSPEQDPTPLVALLVEDRKQTQAFKGSLGVYHQFISNTILHQIFDTDQLYYNFWILQKSQEAEIYFPGFLSVYWCPVGWKAQQQYCE